MSDTPSDGGPACKADTLDSSGSAFEMSLRDWYAGKFLAAMIASETQGDGMMCQYPANKNPDTWRSQNAAAAYDWAESMLTEKAKRCTKT